jgi:hypothetical protein
MITAINPAAARLLISIKFNIEGMNWKKSNQSIHLTGITFLKSEKAMMKQIRTRMEKNILKLLRKGDLIRD